MLMTSCGDSEADKWSFQINYKLNWAFTAFTWARLVHKTNSSFCFWLCLVCLQCTWVCVFLWLWQGFSWSDHNMFRKRSVTWWPQWLIKHQDHGGDGNKETGMMNWDKEANILSHTWSSILERQLDREAWRVSYTFVIPADEDESHTPPSDTCVEGRSCQSWQMKPFTEQKANTNISFSSHQLCDF